MTACRLGQPDPAWLDRERARYAGLGAEALAAWYPSTADEAFVGRSGLVYGADAVTGELIFSRERDVKVEPLPWAECKWRVAAVDPGGTDPTAITVVGVTPREQFHVYGEWSKRGPVGMEQVSEYLGPIHAKAPFDLIFTDGLPAAASLRGYGWSMAMEANKAKDARIQAVSMLLREGLLTVDPKCTGIIDEFSSYWYVDRPDDAIGGKSWDTRTPRSRHHADRLDTLGYNVLGVIEHLPRDPTQMEIKWARVERERELTWKEKVAKRQAARKAESRS